MTGGGGQEQSVRPVQVAGLRRYHTPEKGGGSNPSPCTMQEQLLGGAPGTRRSAWYPKGGVFDSALLRHARVAQFGQSTRSNAPRGRRFESCLSLQRNLT